MARILVTGHDGYIGAAPVPLLERGHTVVGLDSGLFERCGLGERGFEIDEIRADVRGTSRPLISRAWKRLSIWPRSRMTLSAISIPT